MTPVVRSCQFLCGRPRHSGKQVPAAWLVRAWQSEADYRARPDRPRSMATACEHDLRYAIRVVTEAVHWPRPFVVLRDVRGL